MNRTTAQRILADCIATYRNQPYTQLAARLNDSPHHHDVIEGTTADGTHYTIEVNILWDDKQQQHVRVMGDLSSDTRGCLLGFIPIFTSDAADGFIIAPDGSFIGEQN